MEKKHTIKKHTKKKRNMFKTYQQKSHSGQSHICYHSDTEKTYIFLKKGGEGLHYTTCVWNEDIVWLLCSLHVVFRFVRLEPSLA